MRRAMAKFLIASWDGGGNTPSAFNLGAWLVGRGHEVRLLGWSPMAARAEAAGLGFAVYPSLPEWPDGVAHEAQPRLLDECLFGSGCGRDIAAAAREMRADVLVVDCFLRPGFEAAAELGVPAAALVHVSYQQFVHEWGAGFVGADVQALLGRCGAVLALQPPGFDVPCPLPPGHVYVGAVGSPDRTRALDPAVARLLQEPGEPWVLLSLSTTPQPGRSEALAGMLPPLARLPVRVLLTRSAAEDGAGGPLPPNVVQTGFVPHDLVLPHMSAAISHAGMSTVATALGAGVPLVCVPQGRDQFGNAAGVERVGAGLSTDGAGVADALCAVLSNPAFEAAARRFRDAMLPLGEGAVAADLVEALAD